VKTAGIVLVALLVAAFLIVWAAGRGTFGSHEGPGELVATPRSATSVAAGEAALADAATEIGVFRPKQILFGDLHVHTTFSFDAFLLSLPVAGGEGSHPPADACDFARYCSALDFWSINDHAFSITPEHWQETVDSVRACNAAAGDPANPDLVSYLGWEWTNVGVTPDNHYGHKNVVIRDLEDGAIPTRPIASVRPGGVEFPTLGLGYVALTQGGRMHAMARYFTELLDVPICADDVNTRELPDDCIEQAPTPADLYRKLDEWDVASTVIPHGTTWGFYTPPGSSWAKQLQGPMHDENRQRLIEVYSGHGDSEVYRDWRAVAYDDDGNAFCPEPRPDYLPTCWQAGEIIRKRCLTAGEDDVECESRAVEARAHAVAAVQAVMLTVPGSTGADFLDAGQCLDCDEPSFNYRPGGSAQYILAVGNFDEDPANPRHFRMGMMASSDNHFARPGTGYKEVRRRGFTESRVASGGGGITSAVLGDNDGPPAARSVPYEYDTPGFNTFESERQASYFLTGGLIATHSAGRDRGAIWDAMQSREVYGTSGPRMLLWFDLLNPPGSRGAAVPMGGVAAMSDAPIFQVRAVGSFEQKPGCPESVGTALGTADLERICKGECYHPSDERRPITRIEIVRIRPQQDPAELVKELIDDPWRSFSCDGDPAGCAVTFTDPEFDGSRETVYYARAYEASIPTINAGGVRCERDANGDCLSVDLCPGDGGPSNDCLAPAEPRAWSSPIWVEPGGASDFATATP
jgi:hypothetical protein